MVERAARNGNFYFQLALSGNMLWASETLPKFFKASQADIVGNNWREFVPHEKVAAIEKKFLTLYTSKIPVFCCNYVCQEKKKTKLIRWILLPLTDENSEIVTVQVIGSQIKGR